ncbi:MAG: 30S ribosomal protein S11 [Candidatus Pacebacteria bacterium]|nr:30S ribosomal protein S11 [Candidatus Paceibacterota bacterium]
MAKKNTKKTSRRKNKKQRQQTVPKGKMYVTATFNNTLVTITDPQGNVVCWSSTGNAGFKGSRKSTPYAATIAVENALTKAQNLGMNQVDVYLKGPGSGRDVALRVIRSKGLKVGMIADMTPMPHNGTRPRKQRN